jgi:hypothetical protein
MIWYSPCIPLSVHGRSHLGHLSIHGLRNVRAIFPSTVFYSAGCTSAFCP